MTLAVPGFLIAGRTPEINDMAKKSGVERVKSYLKSDEGASILPKVAKTAMDLVAEMARDSGHQRASKSLRKIAKGFGATTKGLFYAAWYVGTIELVEQSSKVMKEGVRDGKFVELIRRCFKWASTSTESILPFFFPSYSTPLKNIQIVTDLASDSIGAYQAGEGWAKADYELNRASAQSDISPEVQEHLKAERGLHLLSLVKSVLSAVAGIFGVLGLVLGFAIVPSVVLLTISLATYSLSIVKHFYKENMTYKPLSDWKIAAPAA